MGGRRSGGTPILMSSAFAHRPGEDAFKWGPPLTTAVPDTESDGLQQLPNYDGLKHRTFLRPHEFDTEPRNAPFADSQQRWREPERNQADYRDPHKTTEADFKSKGGEEILCGAVPFKATKRGDVLEAPWPLLLNNKMCLYKPPLELVPEPGWNYSDEALERRREYVRKMKRRGKGLNDDVSHNYPVFASEVPRFVDQQHAVESADFARASGHASLNVNRPQTPEDGGPRGRARSRVEKRPPPYMPSSALASRSTRGMYDQHSASLQITQSLKGWRNSPGRYGRAPELSTRPVSPTFRVDHRPSPCFMPTNVRFPDDLDLLYATMKKSGELKRLDDDSCSTDYVRPALVEDVVTEPEPPEVFLTEAPAPAQRDIRAY